MLRHLLYAIAAIICLLSCEGNGYEHFATEMDSLSRQNPRAAIDSIDNWLVHHPNIFKRKRMTLTLCRLRAQNSADIPFTSDSVAREVVD